MNFIKFLMTILALLFGVMLVFWLFGVVYSLFWYGFWIAALGAIGYGGYRMFRRSRSGLHGRRADEIEPYRDFDLSWEEYSRKYLPK